MSLTLPPSIRRPPRIPEKASASPPMLAKSIRASAFFGSLASPTAVSFVLSSATKLSALENRFRRSDSPAESDDPPNYLIGRFENHELLSRGETDHRVRSGFNVLD